MHEAFFLVQSWIEADFEGLEVAGNVLLGKYARNRRPAFLWAVGSIMHSTGNTSFEHNAGLLEFRSISID